MELPKKEMKRRGTTSSCNSMLVLLFLLYVRKRQPFKNISLSFAWNFPRFNMLFKPKIKQRYLKEKESNGVFDIKFNKNQWKILITPKHDILFAKDICN